MLEPEERTALEEIGNGIQQRRDDFKTADFVKEEVANGDRMMADGQFPAAVKYYDKAVAKDPEVGRMFWVEHGGGLAGFDVGWRADAGEIEGRVPHVCESWDLPPRNEAISTGPTLQHISFSLPHLDRRWILKLFVAGQAAASPTHAIMPFSLQSHVCVREIRD
jgi:hypothetical protein